MDRIPFTQYIRPHGRRELIHIEREPDVCAQAKSLIDDGYYFEAEVLTNGMVSLTACFDGDDIAFEIGPNNIEVPNRVDRLVAKAERHRKGEA